MSHNFYLSPSIGDGSAPTAAAVRRPLILDTLQGAGAFTIRAVFNRPRSTWLCWVYASAGAHTAVQAVTGVVRMIPLTSVTLEQLRDNLNTPLGTIFPGATLASIRNSIEAKGFPMSWASSTNTLKEVAVYLRQLCHLGESCDSDNNGTGNSQLYSFLSANTSATVGSLSAAVRNAGSAWMIAHGLSTSWITGSTTVGQVLEAIGLSATLPKMITLDDEI